MGPQEVDAGLASRQNIVNVVRIAAAQICKAVSRGQLDSDDTNDAVAVFGTAEEQSLVTENNQRLYR